MKKSCWLLLTLIKLTFKEHKQHLSFGFRQPLAKYREPEWYRNPSLKAMDHIYQIILYSPLGIIKKVNFM